MSNIETGGMGLPTNWVNISGMVVPNEDGFTLRQYAAIKLQVPNSGDAWLDEMIVQSLRDEFAAKYISGWMSNPATPDAMREEVSRWAYAMADEMLKARGS